MSEELTIFARFHARQGQEEAVAAALLEVAGPTGAEPGCLEIGDYRSISDPRLFHVHSRWVDEAAFETHAGLAHTVAFLERVEPLIDHPLEVSRSRPLPRGLAPSCEASGSREARQGVIRGPR